MPPTGSRSPKGQGSAQEATGSRPPLVLSQHLRADGELLLEVDHRRALLRNGGWEGVPAKAQMINHPQTPRFFSRRRFLGPFSLLFPFPFRFSLSLFTIPCHLLPFFPSPLMSLFCFWISFSPIPLPCPDEKVPVHQSTWGKNLPDSSRGPPREMPPRCSQVSA